MITFTPHPDDAFKIYSDAVGRCKSPQKKASLYLLGKGIEDNYNEYKCLFLNKTLHKMPLHKISDTDAANLRSLYTPKAAVRKKLKEDYKQRLNTNRVYWNRCPYCGYAPSDTLEHILPKELYPEYAIHALNLIPCCPLCNSHKGTKVKDKQNAPEFINFYYHDPQAIEFLTVNITLDAFGYPKFHYELTFPPKTDPSYCLLIENHFKNLKLLTRYDDEIVTRYTEEEVRIRTNLRAKTVDETLNTIREWMNGYSAEYGRNHYYTVMLRGLVTSPSYKSYLVNLKSTLTP